MANDRARAHSYMVRKYGENEVDGVHHYVTQEQRNADGRIVLKGDIQVPQDFTYRKYDGTFVPLEELTRPVSNYDYESEINDYKRNVYLLRRDYINQFVEEFEEMVGYLPSAETDPDSEAKRSENVVQEQFISVKPTYQTLVGQTSSIEFASTQEYTSRTVTLELEYQSMSWQMVAQSVLPSVRQALLLLCLQVWKTKKWLTPSVLDPPVVKPVDLQDPLDLAAAVDLQDLAAAGSSGGIWWWILKDRDLFHTVAILSDDPHVALQVQFVGILLLDKFCFKRSLRKMLV